MAKQSGIIKLEGTIGDITFYKSKNGHIARHRGTLDGSRIAGDKNFQRTRENNSEFASTASAGKLLRDTVRSMSLNVADKLLVSRLFKTLTRIKNLDITSERGQRSVAIGITTAQGKTALHNFDFNAASVLSSTLYAPFQIEPETYEIVIAELTPQKHLVFPAGATHVSLSAGAAFIDFATGASQLIESPVMNLPLNNVSREVVLTPSGKLTKADAGRGVKLVLLRIEFYQVVGGQQYALQNGAYNALTVVSAS